MPRYGLLKVCALRIAPINQSALMHSQKQNTPGLYHELLTQEIIQFSKWSQAVDCI
jgi:hypothetical protein